jgi:very-short-patch-repair endonuclease
LRADLLRDARELALDQHGVVTSHQLDELGLAVATRTRWVRSERLVRLAPHTYLFPAMVDDLSHLQAVQLAYPGAVASHRAAAYLWKLDGLDGFALDVTLRYGAKPGLGVAHRSADLEPFDVVEVKGLRATDPTRTLCDLGKRCSLDVLERATECGLRRGLTSIPRLDWRCRNLAAPGRQGPRQLRMVLERRPLGAPPTESDLETQYLQCLRAHGVPQPVRQFHVVVDGMVVARLDFAWPWAKTFAEVDGWRFHRDKVSFQRDRTRQNAVVVALGWCPLRFTFDDIDGDPTGTADQTRAALSSTERSQNEQFFYESLRQPGRTGGAAR